MANTETSWWSKDTVAVVTGGNKGIGFEIVRSFASKGLTVVLTARDKKRGETAMDALKAEGLKSVVFHALDVNSPESTKNLAAWLKKEYGGIDILINNAGVIGLSVTYDTAQSIIDTNYRGMKNVTKLLLPLLRASSAGARIVTVSSRMGLYNRLGSDSLKQKFKDEANYTEEMVDSLATEYLEDTKAGRLAEKGWITEDPAGRNPMYSESKIFVNAYAVLLAKSLSESQPAGHEIFVATMCPGVTRTEMYDLSVEAGFEAPEGHPVKTVADGADTAVWLALLPKEELTTKHGKFYAERAEFPFGWENPHF